MALWHSLVPRCQPRSSWPESSRFHLPAALPGPQPCLGSSPSDWTLAPASHRTDFPRTSSPSCMKTPARALGTLAWLPQLARLPPFSFGAASAYLGRLSSHTGLSPQGHPELSRLLKAFADTMSTAWKGPPVSTLKSHSLPACRASPSLALGALPAAPCIYVCLWPPVTHRATWSAGWSSGQGVLGVHWNMSDQVRNTGRGLGRAWAQVPVGRQGLPSGTPACHKPPSDVRWEVAGIPAWTQPSCRP